MRVHKSFLLLVAIGRSSVDPALVSILAVQLSVPAATSLLRATSWLSAGNLYAKEQHTTVPSRSSKGFRDYLAAVVTEAIRSKYAPQLVLDHRAALCRELGMRVECAHHAARHLPVHPVDLQPSSSAMNLRTPTSSIQSTQEQLSLSQFVPSARCPRTTDTLTRHQRGS